MAHPEDVAIALVDLPHPVFLVVHLVPVDPVVHHRSVLVPEGFLRIGSLDCTPGQAFQGTRIGPRGEGWGAGGSRTAHALTLASKEESGL